MNDIMLREKSAGSGFIPERYLLPGEDEYRLRFLQQSKDPASYRCLRADEIAVLRANGNQCDDWQRVQVRDPFDPNLVRSSEFSGLVRIGKLSSKTLEHHDMLLKVGISDSRIISCDIGDDCAIHSCHYMAHYIVGDRCILINNDEIHATDHAKWGNGILKEGEPEDVRVWLDLMNEAGGRSVLPFDGMLCADAWLWAKRREDTALLERFAAMTQARFEYRRGEYGTIGDGSVLKSNRIIKDVRIGECAYIKGANKLKNLTINSSELERTQIGEGVELVNGIVGCGCRVFYGSKAVRFVMGTNSALKYGARLIHSVLGDNSTVSCCELLNNLIFPAHEQHHNTSFLVAAVVKGQSNMAAGATLGSNHNSRANDGELEAGRGFWPGLSVSVKHSSRFASYCLLSKGDYHHELNVPLPFALVADNAAKDRLEVMPAYWWMYNMYALLRNETKFLSRDTRQLKNQHIEFSPFAPDIAEEMFDALYRLQLYTGRSYYAQSRREASDDEAAAKGKELLRGPKEDVDALEIRADDMENSSRPVVILKARRAYKAYRHMLRFYAVSTLIAYFSERPDARFEDAQEVLEGPRVREWDNLGGQIVGRHRVENLVSMVKSGELGSWDEVHAHYDLLWSEYALEKAQHAWATLCELKGGADLWKESFVKEICRFSDTTAFIEEQVLSTRAKDFANEFRRTTFRGEEEMRAVLGSPEGSSFVRQCRADMERWRARVDVLLDRLTS